MCAKKSKKANAPASSPATPSVAATAMSDPTPSEAAPFVPWIESSDPKKRQIAKVVLVAVWIYVAALCLLAIDKWFNLGIFGPKIPPLP